jgi:hypothetical protein
VSQRDWQAVEQKFVVSENPTFAPHGDSIQANSEINVATTVQMTFPLLNSLAGSVR